ncbi:unnamed protein product [Caenorhabditis sp. 36 PRJEB53466]|nr:unnamed protein product [Caenorhabditis sp. 36 PRJEB53466]
MVFWKVSIILPLIAGCSSATLSACATGVTCPPGGLWSEWTTTGSCATSCGACSNLFYTRTCLSQPSNCSCTGVTSRYIPCNITTCTFPAQRTCCIPYVTMLINGSMQCGPIPQDKSSTYTPCCPSGGLWSSWSGFGRNEANTAWIQTRQCLSSSVGCPCTGSTINTQTSCPCPAMQSVDSVASACNYSYYYSPANFSVNDATCAGTAVIIANNNVRPNVACNPYTTYKYFWYTPAIDFTIPESSTCNQDRPFNCEQRKLDGWDGLTMNISFTCDTELMKWRYDWGGYAVDGYVQLVVAFNTTE